MSTTLTESIAEWRARTALVDAQPVEEVLARDLDKDKHLRVMHEHWEWNGHRGVLIESIEQFGFTTQVNLYIPGTYGQQTEAVLLEWDEPLLVRLRPPTDEVRYQP